jgi:spermidine/putrescine-binding protein
MEQAATFDPGNKYAVPYTYGTLGIMYNTTMVEEEPTSWSALWDEQYEKSIVMYESVRDSLTPALKLLGYSLNTTDEAELQEATQMLIEQKPLVYSYVMDQIKDLMINGEVALGLAYSGEVLAIQEENEDIAFVVPDEGSNYYMDAWVIPSNAENKENAEAWINFLCRPDIAQKNFEYITYSTPNEAAVALLDDYYLENEDVFPSEEVIDRCEVFEYLGDEMDQLYATLWKQVKAAK